MKLGIVAFDVFPRKFIYLHKSLQSLINQGFRHRGFSLKIHENYYI